MATAAVTTSIARMPCMGRPSSRSAPRGGETMFMAPCNVWLRPATRARCFSGTMSEVEACIAGQWNPPAVARMNMIA